MSPQAIKLSHNHQVIVGRFVAACQTDERVVAALLVGSYAKGTADAHSDLDLYLITTDEAYDDFIAARETFIEKLGEPLFLEDFGSMVTLFSIFSEGTECELSIGRESQLNQLFNEPYRVLLDKKGSLAGVVLTEHEPAQAEQLEMLHKLVYVFWHELGHFTTALGRGQLWWAQGQLEALRMICVNLARLRHNFFDEEVGVEGYFKIEQVLPVEQLSPLQVTFGPKESKAMLQAAHIIIRFYRELAPPLARAHGITYPADLDRVMVAKLEKLGQL